MRSTLLMVCLLGTSFCAVAQNAQSSWTSLSRLSPGQKIRIVESDSKKHTGAFENISDTAITLRDANGEASIPRQDVRSVKLMRSDRRLRNTLLGLAIGAGAGAGITAAAWESHGFLGGRGDGALVGAAIGGVAGLAIGVSLPTGKTIYVVPSH
jgi:hypothetical protein